MRPVTFILLLAGVVTAATATEHGPTCRRAIPAELIRDLWSQTKQLIGSLPKEEKASRKLRLLPKFCTNCPERLIGWLEVRELIGVYQSSVFNTEFLQKLLPLHYNVLLHRLQHTLQHCVSSSKHSQWSESIKKVEKKIKRMSRGRRRDEGVMKAVGEFIFVLRWIDELREQIGL
ncbi:interleukin-26 [Centroberyx affinis]|uniref:interleukin-26 n=1 Tax=Centroberyx affinis TaxID=166261 RepID=UPI003A5BD4FA